MSKQELGKILIYQNEKGDTKIDVYFEEDTIWMSQKSLAQLYQTSPQNITMHIKNIYTDGELLEEITCKEFLQVQNEGGRQVERLVKHYDFRMILAIGYRVRSNVGIHFRTWASPKLPNNWPKSNMQNLMPSARCRLQLTLSSWKPMSNGLHRRKNHEVSI